MQTPTSGVVDPNTSNQVMFHMLNFMNAEVEAYDRYSTGLDKRLQTAEWKTQEAITRGNFYRELWEEVCAQQAATRVGTDVIVTAVDNMYNLYTEMARQVPEIGRFHEQLSRIVLQAEAGRRMVQPIDLTTEEEEEDDMDIWVHQETTVVIDLTEDSDEDM